MDYRTKTEFNIQDIIKLIPHRYPFILIDRIENMIPGESLTAIKNVTINEPFFQGHFPGQPVMPGVLILESMAQAASFLALKTVDNPLSKNMLFSGVDNAKFRKPIMPGDTIVIKMRLVKRKLNLCKFEGEAYVGESLVTKAAISATIVDREGA
ncbi:MAG: 3-hydroxyacyl-ACP dehydratase FabZ [Candidatus Marinimicrobia bacterium]|jgi:3-hydroxyacyl-[acyl-carrier-protein] dehydratase|nr:3-hydroxyacyl-ACP dehydratase FabZ [Candidatus Neomarinimicrobiota bacterium]MBT4383594.1 3-hydroxyacyl-ACP dehydratase FabZ [Candidatus Neomarinimicrobiota bacterium]MBT4635757.1 3-hydroxyacyl-ACP dehydratase FabZ [Candidatus Neomarinimicrobiota bacterium]MBT4734066.1 3-hydroxyacyl-ACP dehydratase FabZ [Candidatus Neomarinimicrobiota bacterium]MBT6113094.1 3-hydroxyacyl-ACP dehydratase FabZ [Candidatus Neomarinimicrobiota bacterium]